MSYIAHGPKIPPNHALVAILVCFHSFLIPFLIVRHQAGPVHALFVRLQHLTIIASMHLPRRCVKSIQPLPSIYTAFPVNYDANSASEHSGKCLIRQIEDGIEVVPLERCNMLSAPILSPDAAEKELFITSQEEASPAEKPLPRLPKSPWARLSLKQRIIAIVGVQIAMILTIGLAMLAARHRASSK
jgi:hypothetical protein